MLQVTQNVQQQIQEFGFTKVVTALELALESDSFTLASLLVAATTLETEAANTLGRCFDGSLIVSSEVYSRITNLVTAIVEELGIADCGNGSVTLELNI